MFTSVGDPFLFLEFFHLLVFPCRHTCSSQTRGTIPTSLLVFVGNVFTPLVSLLFLECKLHCGTCSLALKARAEAVLTTILYMPFDVVYYLFLCVLLLLRQLGLLSMEWYPSLILKFSHQLIFPCRHMCSLETLGTIPTSLLVFWKTFLLPLLLSMECKLHSGNLSPEALEVMQTKTGQ